MYVEINGDKREGSHTTMNTVLAVDDEEINLELIENYLNEADIDTVSVNRGDKALEILHEAPSSFSAILLDRMMPGIDGIEVLSQIKADEKISHIPVIIQTASVGKENMLEGLNAGAHYYVTKPYDNQTLVTIVTAAIRDYRSYTGLNDTLTQSAVTMKLMDKGFFSFKSINEGRKLASLLANTCPNPDNVKLGLTELMVNAIEHGNLGISYDEKSRLNARDEWESEIARRLALPSNKNKNVSINFSRNKKEITFLIVDEGEGFDWTPYMKISPNRLLDSHGRGIAIANSISFDQINYLGKGNQVCMTIRL